MALERAAERQGRQRRHHAALEGEGLHHHVAVGRVGAFQRVQDAFREVLAGLAGLYEEWVLEAAR